MTAVAFDTLKFARTLRDKAHLTSEQAEGLADALVEVLDGNLATKADVRELRSDVEALRIQTRADIEALRLSTQADIEALRPSVKSDLDALRLSLKSEVDALRLSLKSEIEALRLSTAGDIAGAKSDLLKWMFGTVGFQTVVILGAVVTLVRSLH